MDSLPPRRWLVRGVVALLVVSLFAPAVTAGVGYLTTTSDPTNLRASVESPANGTTVVSIQGFHFRGYANDRKPARLVAVGPKGTVQWVHDGTGFDATWFYDVDPLENGNLLVTSTAKGSTLVYELDPQTGERVWTQRLPIHDTHDVDLINGDQLLVANMRVPNKGDRLFIYDMGDDEVVWRWQFDEHFPTSGGGGAGDWTHVNDVDKIGEGRYLVSPRNFDQVIVVDRSTKEITMRLGSDDDHDVLYEQHNPQYLESESGNPTILVADSENDRVVEYARRNGTWTRTWTLSGGLNWPRDADRLPNGNTLVVDTMYQRVVEVTPKGEVVWEFYAPWAPYAVERTAYGDEAGGPTMADLNVTGNYSVHGSAGIAPTAEKRTVSFWVVETFSGTPLENAADEFARRWSHVTPWIRPVWMGSWDFLYALVGLGILVGWSVGELVYQRDRIRRTVGRYVR
ncbi:aryl-sulfate sulfotransferase [Halomicrococcus sp. NG-SE-24]|uniref:aryl-sulfate sulfotransferase n=1 Tax=Halomicrococcus sp. NG-SE-24 TaxID=3436928 RepID=UPI003D96BAFE